MKIYITGVGGLVGSTVAALALQRGWSVSGSDADYRGQWFGSAGSVSWRLAQLQEAGVEIYRADFREVLGAIRDVDVILHCASQPSHDFSRSWPREDAEINFTGTLRLLEATRQWNPDAVFVFLSTNKVYGDRVNDLAFVTQGKRLVPQDWKYRFGIGENFQIDHSRHTPFGVSKLAADLMVQEYRSCYGLKTVCFRCGCITGSGGSAVEQQGFLGYLVHCATQGLPYTIYGYEGYQVRDNLAAQDLAEAILLYAQRPAGAIYNMGGGPSQSLSVLEAIDLLADLGYPLAYTCGPERYADHRWWITNTQAFHSQYGWKPKISVQEVIREMVGSARDRRAASC